MFYDNYITKYNKNIKMISEEYSNDIISFCKLME